jgi:hypothetical protein
MKHILNNLTEEEKNSIREQHTGGMKVMTENFSKLLNSKLGNAKPLVSEQDVNEFYFFDDDNDDSEIKKAPLRKAEKGPFASAGDGWYDADEREVDEPTDYSEERSFGPDEQESFMDYINNCNTKWCLTTKRMYDIYAKKPGGIRVRK